METSFFRARIDYCDSMGSAVENSPGTRWGVLASPNAGIRAEKCAAEASWCANKTDGWLTESAKDSTGPERAVELADMAGGLAVRALRAACEAEQAAAVGWLCRAWKDARMAWRSAEQCATDSMSLRRIAAEKKAARPAEESAERVARAAG